MDTLPPNSDSEARDASGELSAVEEKVARRIVSTHRARLDWLLRVPEWEALFEVGMGELGYEGRRQGIGFDAALMALPLEHKYELICWVLQAFQKHLRRATVQGMVRVVGVERFNELDLDEVISARQWSGLRRKLSWRLGQEHRRYKHAQQLLFTGFRPLIDRVVARLVFDARYRCDCVQEGSLGLLQAIDRVDDGDQAFAAYALSWIRRAIKNHLMRQRLPVHAPVNLISKVSSARKQGEGDSGGKPYADASRLTVLLFECLRSPSVSLDEVLPGGDEPLGQALSDPRGDSPAEAADRSDLCGLMGNLMMSLTEKQRTVLQHRYGLRDGRAKTLAQIARTVGISHQQVSMRERRALERLHTLLRPMAAEIHG